LPLENQLAILQPPLLES
jgi:hypothetical protein